MRRIHSLNLQQQRELAIVTQAYADGVSAGRTGAATNPHPRGSKPHAAWANGYAAGKAGRMR